MKVVLYEDQAVEGLFPITLARQACDVRIAGTTLMEAVSKVFGGEVYGSARDYLPQKDAFNGNATGPVLFLNARLAPSFQALSFLLNIIKRTGEDGAMYSDGVLVGIFVKAFENVTYKDDVSRLMNSFSKNVVSHELEWKLLENPEDVIFFNDDALSDNLTTLSKGLKRKGFGNVFVGEGVRIHKTAVLDTSKGAIVISKGATIGALSVLKGPLFIGEGSEIKEHTVIEASSIGPVCKVGGEVSHTVFDAYSNKQHYGSVSSSYIGRWVNVGAGTSVATLKHTYSPVSMGGRDTGAQFLGTVLGDFSKTSVNTTIFPGKIIGISSHLYQTVTSDVPSFSSFVREGKVVELPPDIAKRSQAGMSFRRGKEFTKEDETLFDELFKMTASDRKEGNVLKVKLSFD